jgi:hypothetical protein
MSSRVSRVKEGSAEKQPAADRVQRISDAAYRRAEQRRFEPGRELDDWLDAERDIDAEDGAGSSADH